MRGHVSLGMGAHTPVYPGVSAVAQGLALRYVSTACLCACTSACPATVLSIGEERVQRREWETGTLYVSRGAPVPNARMQGTTQQLCALRLLLDTLLHGMWLRAATVHAVRVASAWLHPPLPLNSAHEVAVLSFIIRLTSSGPKSSGTTSEPLRSTVPPGPRLEIQARVSSLEDYVLHRVSRF